MVSPSDPEFAATARVVRGEARLGPPLDRLASWIEATWGVRVVHVVYDRTLHGAPRLQIIVWERDDEAPFRDGAGVDRAVQAAIAHRFTSLLGGVSRRRYDTRGLWVVASAFAPLARAEALNQLSQDALDAFAHRLGDAVWGVQTALGQVVVFAHTDAQAQALARDEAAIREQVVALAAPHDAFGVLTPETLSLSFDSKETVDRDFEGSWFFYWR